jgi:hypothetical protein
VSHLTLSLVDVFEFSCSIQQLPYKIAPGLDQDFPRLQRRVFTCLPVTSNSRTKRLKARDPPQRRRVAFLPNPTAIFMRIVSKAAFLFLIWPISLMAQDQVAPDQPLPPVQSPTQDVGAQSFAPPSGTTTSPSSAPIQNPVPEQTKPAFLYVHPSKPNRTTVWTGYAPALDVSAGLSVTSLALPSSGHAVLGGVDASIATDSGKHFGAKLDLSYQRSPNVYHSGRPMDMLSYLIGPVFYPSNGRLLSTSVHLLVGGARVAGPVPSENGTLSLAHVHYPAWAAGGGVEYRLSPAFGFRVSVDYLQTHFYNSSGAVRRQNDIRIVNSFVYYLGKSIRNP